MLVNNIDIADFKAELLKKDIQTAEVTIYDDWLRQSNTPLFLGKKEKYKKITIQLFIEDANEEMCLINISNLTKQFEKCIIKFDDLSFHYDCTLVSNTHREIEGDLYIYVLDVELRSGSADGTEVSVTAKQVDSISINVLGNLPTPAIIEIMPLTDIPSITLTGFTKRPIEVKNLLANVPITIDGEKCTVTETDIDTVITPTTGANKWNFRKYSMASLISPEEWDISFAPIYSDIPLDSSYSQKLVTDAPLLANDLGYTYLGHLKTAVNVAVAKTISFTFSHDDGATVYLNGVIVYSHTHTSFENDGDGFVSMNLMPGWNVIEILWANLYGPDGVWDVTPVIGSQVDALNCFYSKSEGDGVVNKFGDTDMWSFPVLQPGINTIKLTESNCNINIKYKPRYI